MVHMLTEDYIDNFYDSINMFYQYSFSRATKQITNKDLKFLLNLVEKIEKSVGYGDFDIYLEGVSSFGFKVLQIAKNPIIGKSAARRSVGPNFEPDIINRLILGCSLVGAAELNAECLAGVCVQRSVRYGNVAVLPITRRLRFKVHGLGEYDLAGAAVIYIKVGNHAGRRYIYQGSPDECEVVEPRKAVAVGADRIDSHK